MVSEPSSDELTARSRMIRPWIGAAAYLPISGTAAQRIGYPMTVTGHNIWVIQKEKGRRKKSMSGT